MEPDEDPKPKPRKARRRKADPPTGVAGPESGTGTDRSLGFFAVELMPDGDVRGIAWWTPATAGDPDLRGRMALLANQLARGRFNDLLARVSRAIGVAVSAREFGEALAEQFEANGRVVPAVRATDVFSPGNPGRPPFGVIN